MGGLLSILRRHRPQQLAICAAEEPAEQEHVQEEQPPAEETDWLGRTALLRAAEAGDEGEVRRLLAAGASASAADRSGRTALMAVARAGAGWLCAMLMDAGADVRARNRSGQTALHAAVMAGDAGEDGPVVVELLLQCGADPHAQDSRGRTALHCALRMSNLDAAEVLVPAVGSRLQRDDEGMTELHWAAANGTRTIVRLMLARNSGAGAERDAEGMTPLARALQARNEETAAVLASEPSPHQPADATGRTVLHWAADAGFTEIVFRLMRRGFSPWAVDRCGRDALNWAVESGARHVVEDILRECGYRECADDHGQTALHVAATVGDAAITELLLRHGADAGRVDSDGRTPLMYAVRFAHKEAAMILLKHGPVKVRQRDRRRRTLLHWAAVGGDVDLVRELLDRGAPINSVDLLRKTPAALAVEHGHEAAATVLVGTDGFRVIHDRAGCTPLHGAAAAGWTRLAMRLLALGAHPYDGGCDNVSPVALAIRAGHYSLAQAISRYRWCSEQLHPVDS